MVSSLYLIFIILFQWMISQNMAEMDLNQYLHKKSAILKSDLKTNRIRRHIEDDEEIVGVYREAELTSKAVIFDLFNKTLVIMDNAIYHVNGDEEVDMKLYARFEHESPLFFKALQYKKTGFMVLSTETSITIYTVTSNHQSPLKVQTIMSPHSADGFLFINADNFYLVSTTNKGLITIYKWLGSHFDEINTLSTSEATKIASFSYKSSEILIVLKSTLHSAVYSFRNGQTRKIQHLQTKNPTAMDVYYENNSPYVLIYQKDETLLYKWNGFEMVLVNKFQWESVVDKSTVAYSNTVPLIIQPYLNKTLIYKIENEHITLHKIKQYSKNYTAVLDVSTGPGHNVTFIAGLNSSNKTSVYRLLFNVERTTSDTEQQGELGKCFHKLERHVLERGKEINGSSSTPKDRKKRSSTNDDELDNISLRLEKLKPLIKTLPNDQHELVVNTKAVIRGDIVTKNLNATNLKFNTINDRTPDKWLRYSEEQTITGPVKVGFLKAKNVTVLGGNVDFDDFLRHNTSQRFKGTYKINKLSAEKIKVNQSRNSVDQTSSHTSPSFNNILKITNLQVDSIDNINWTEFENSVFKAGEDLTIEGNLTVSNLQTSNLQTKEINGVKVDNLMTKTTDQVINSTVEFNSIKADNVQCQTVNDIDITKAVRADQNGTIIKSFVQIDEFHVFRDLELVGDHGLGNNGSNPFQKYLGKVTINGTLHVRNLNMISNVSIRGKKYPANILEQYWNKDGNQTIPVNVLIGNMTVPHLNTNKLNGVSMDKFASTGGNLDVEDVVFRNLTVAGNVNVNKWMGVDLDKLLGGVGTEALLHEIKGKKRFSTLIVNKLNTSKTNWEALRENSSNHYNVKKIVVKGNLTGKITTETVNGVNIKEFKKNILHLNRSENITEITIKNVTAKKLHINKINGHNMTTVLDKLQKMIDRKHFKKINVHGDVQLKNIYGLKYLNEYELEEFLMQNATSGVFKGDVNFTQSVFIRNLQANIINNIDFPNLTGRMLHEISNQTITGLYTFKNLKTTHLLAQQINNKSTQGLIDVSKKQPQNILAPRGIKLKKATLQKSIRADKMRPCDIYEAMKKIHYPDTREWSTVEIYGNVTLLDETSDLRRILQKSVKIDEENVISAPVVINGNIFSDMVDAERINEVHLDALFNDVVLSDSDEKQIITGHKIFTNSVTASTVVVTENADIPEVNDIVIGDFYDKIIKKSDVHNITINGKKTFFAGLQTNRILANNVSGINTENIVSTVDSRPIANVVFDNITITGDLIVGKINDYDLNQVLANRLLVNFGEQQIVDAVCHFDQIEITGNLITQTINNISINNVVFNNEQQKILAPKTFLKNVTLLGNLEVDSINGINITEEYAKAILRGRDEFINGSLTIKYPMRISGNINAKTINGYLFSQIEDIMNKSKSRSSQEHILEVKSRIQDLIKDKLPSVKHTPRELMYIEKLQNLQMPIQNIVDAKARVMDKQTILEILGQESHECNLAENCKCPVQYTVHVTTRNCTLTRNQQRVYSYSDGDVTVQLQTNSVSTSSRCRFNDSEALSEMAKISWKIGNVSITSPNTFQGYISGAEFFTLNNVTYAIIARYYDATIDSYDLDCTVVRINQNKTITVVQRIPTHGAWTLYLLHTAQGTTIVIGNLDRQPSTEIHRFNSSTEKFELIRTVPIGCTKAVGVVLGTDSLIILADDKAPLQVLKYQPKFDSYYYYQMFALGEPVLGMSVFYMGGFGISDAYLSITTEDTYRIYSFQYIDGWKLESKGSMRGLRNLIPFDLDDELYLFAASREESSLLKIVKHSIRD